MLAPESAALILIDYQPPQASMVESIDRFMLINNFVAPAKTDLDQFIHPTEQFNPKRYWKTLI